MVYSNFDGSDLTFPGKITGAGEKAWTKGTFTFAGHYIMDTATYDNYGWGTYEIDGNKYEEHILYHHLSEASIGKTIKMILEVKNDTLYQKWPLNDNWQLPEKYSIEKYVRLKQ